MDGGTSTRYMLLVGKARVAHTFGAVINKLKGNFITVITTKPTSMTYANITMNLI